MVPLQVIPGRQFAVGVTVMSTEVVAVLIDMSATISASQRIPVDGGDSDAVDAAVAETVHALPRQVRGVRSRAGGVGVGVGGQVDRDRGPFIFPRPSTNNCSVPDAASIASPWPERRSGRPGVPSAMTLGSLSARRTHWPDNSGGRSIIG